MWRSYLSVCFWLLFCECACAQVTTSSGQPLLRMERAQAGEVSCVLVQDDGSYRLEKMYRVKTDIYAGAPGSIQLDRLKALLANQGLVKLSQADIHDSLIGDTIDALLIAIRRGNAWQELHFPSPDSRKRSKESVEPLLHWFQSVQKEKPGAARVSGDPTRCMPTRARGDSGSMRTTSSSVIHPAAQYLFRIWSSHAYREVESTCTVVFKDGHFHSESSHQAYLGKRRDKISEGQLDPSALEELSRILNSPELKGAPASADPGNDKPIYMQEGTATDLSIPREERVQNLRFLTAQNTIGNPLEIGGASNLGYRMPDRKLLNPLQRWMKENTDKQAHKVETDGVGNDCYPSKSTAASDKPASE